MESICVRERESLRQIEDPMKQWQWQWQRSGGGKPALGHLVNGSETFLRTLIPLKAALCAPAAAAAKKHFTCRLWNLCCILLLLFAFLYIHIRIFIYIFFSSFICIFILWLWGFFFWGFRKIMPLRFKKAEKKYRLPGCSAI